MIAQDLLVSIRFTIGDMSAATVSDYQLFEVVNAVLININNTLATMNSDLITEEVILPVAGNADLPDNFQAVVSVFDASGVPLEYASKNSAITTRNYRIRKNKIYSLASEVQLVYKASFPRVINKTVVIPLPDAFSELIKKYAVMLLKGDINKSDQTMFTLLANDVYKLAAGREFTSLDISPTFYV